MYASQTLKMDFPIALYLFFFIKHGLLLNVELADNWPGWPVSSGDQPRGPIPGNAGEHILFYFVVVVVSTSFIFFFTWSKAWEGLWGGLQTCLAA